jgi:hypothetical protein
VSRPLRPLAVAAAIGATIAGLLLGAAPARADDVPPPADSVPAAPGDPTPVEPASPVPDADPAASPAEDSAAAIVPAQPTTLERVGRLPLRAGATGWRVRVVQERLAWLGYDVSAGNRASERMGESTTAAVKRFQAKFGFTPTGVVGAGTYGLLDAVAGRVGRLPQSCLGERTICIDKTQRLVRLVERGKVSLTLDARFGFVGAETDEGTFRVTMKSRDHTSSLYRTWMPFALFFSGGQAVHYSPYFARDGYNGGSHGCVNLRDFDRARWLFDRVPTGTRVHVYRS